MVNRKSFVNYFTSSSLLLSLTAIDAVAVEENRLWLPVKDHTHYLSLKHAAEAAERLDRCTKVLQGTIDKEQSTPNHPIFRILCKQRSGLTYNEMVDGVTLEPLTTVAPVEVVPTVEDLEGDKKARFSECDQAVKRDTEFMTGLKWHYDGYMEPESFENEVAVFSLDFDATNPDGNILEYRAFCSADGTSAAKLRIKKRPKQQAAE